MNIKLPVLLLIAGILALMSPGYRVAAQCTPMSAEECPDPENNGEICPDSLADGFLNQLYSQVATILTPLSDTNNIPIHHLTLQSVDNLPPGLTWESNAPNNEFLAGNYYCILMEGVPTETGVFNLEVVVDVYINVLGFPVYALTITDSTSLAIEILDNTGIAENNGLVVAGSYPNPFSSWTSFRIVAADAGEARFELFNLQGQRVYSVDWQLSTGEQYYHFNGGDLPAGTYLYAITTGRNSARGMIIRHDRD